MTRLEYIGGEHGRTSNELMVQFKMFATSDGGYSSCALTAGYSFCALTAVMCCVTVWQGVFCIVDVCLSVCVCNIWIGVKLLSFSFFCPLPFLSCRGLRVPWCASSNKDRTNADVISVPGQHWRTCTCIFLTLLVYMSKTPVIFFWRALYTRIAVGLYVNDCRDLYWRGRGLSQEPQ